MVKLNYTHLSCPGNVRGRVAARPALELHHWARLDHYLVTWLQNVDTGGHWNYNIFVIDSLYLIVIYIFAYNK